MDHLLPCVLDYVGHPVPQQVLPSLYPRHSLWNNKQSCFIYLTFRDRFIGMQAIVEKREKKNKSKVCLSPPPKKMLRTPLVPYVSQILLLNYFTLFYLNHCAFNRFFYNWVITRTDTNAITTYNHQSDGEGGRRANPICFPCSPK